MNENNALENYRDQIKQLEKEHELSESNKEMFYRLWIKWAGESHDIERAINRLKKKIDHIQETTP